MIDLGKNRLTVVAREEQMGKSKSQGDRKIKVVTSWEYSKECNPLFARLMSLLLQKPKDNQPIETVRIDEEHKDEQC